jgi:hypothetical protein
VLPAHYISYSIKYLLKVYSVVELTALLPVKNTVYSFVIDLQCVLQLYKIMQPKKAEMFRKYWFIVNWFLSYFATVWLIYINCDNSTLSLIYHDNETLCGRTYHLLSGSDNHVDNFRFLVSDITSFTIQAYDISNWRKLWKHISRDGLRS